MLTPDQAKDLVRWAGGKSAAARAIGVSWPTFQYWLDPEKNKARQRDLYHADPDPVRERMREWYWNLSGYEYNARMLQQRRIKALHRRAKREQRRAD